MYSHLLFDKMFTEPTFSAGSKLWTLVYTTLMFLTFLYLDLALHRYAAFIISNSVGSWERMMTCGLGKEFKWNHRWPGSEFLMMSQFSLSLDPITISDGSIFWGRWLVKPGMPWDLIIFTVNKHSVIVFKYFNYYIFQWDPRMGEMGSGVYSRTRGGIEFPHNMGASRRVIPKYPFSSRSHLFQQNVTLLFRFLQPCQDWPRIGVYDAP